MSLNETEQIKILLNDKKNILIVFRKNYSFDSVASSLALALFLEKMGKRVDIVCQDFNPPKTIQFLKSIETIKSGFNYLQKFILNIDVKDSGLSELSYDVKDDKLKIYITPNQGFLTRDHIKTATSDFRYDLIFVIDTPDLEALGKIYDNNTDLFFKKPMINIDSQTNNEHFGQINFVDITTVSTSEVIYNLIKNLGPEFLDKDIASALLTGIIANTHSFKDSNIKPQTMNLASELMNLGADREHIVKNLYRTRSISTLKLWGVALSQLQNDNTIGLAWTTITRDDFIRSGSHAFDLYEIVGELLTSSPEVKIFVLFHEQTETNELPRIHIILNADKNYDAKNLLLPFGMVLGDKKQATAIVAGKSLKEVESEVIEYIKKTVQ